jgi:hypothetical protein
MFTDRVRQKFSDCEVRKEVRPVFRVFLNFLFVIAGVAANNVRAQESFYKGKVIRIIEAYDAGGGYDTYARAIAGIWESIFPAIRQWLLRI